MILFQTEFELVVGCLYGGLLHSLQQITTELSVEDNSHSQYGEVIFGCLLRQRC